MYVQNLKKYSRLSIELSCLPHCTNNIRSYELINSHSRYMLIHVNCSNARKIYFLSFRLSIEVDFICIYVGILPCMHIGML